MSRRLPSILLLLGLVALACGTAAATEEHPESTGQPPPASSPKVPLKPLSGQVIVSYNVENLFDTLNDPATNDEDFLPGGRLHWTSARYRHKLEQLARAISWAGPELPPIVGLTEVENRAVVEDLVHTRPLADGGYTVVHFDSPDERGIDVALLVRSSFAAVRKQEALKVPLGRDRTRDVLHAELELADSIVLHVFEDHWPSRREGTQESEPKRMAAARVVRGRVDDILAQEPQAKVLIMGDFNDYPQDRSIQEGLRASCDLRSTADLIDLMCAGTSPKSVEGSYLHDGKWGYLDQMIVSRGLLAGKGPKAVSAQALWDERLMFKHPKFGLAPNKTYNRDDYKGGFSDHLPVVLRIQ
ncbi:MAG: endonuclease [Flavobacteriales bacterium]